MGVTTTGLNKAVTSGLTSTSYPYIGVGTGSATFVVGLTDMGTEIDADRQAVLDATGIGAMADIRDYLTNAQGNGTLTEVGLWTASSGGTLLAYSEFVSSIVKTSSRPMLINYIMAFKNAAVTAGLTWAGLAAARASGFTNAAFPYVATHATALSAFTPFIEDAGTETERVACTWGISGAAATGSGTIVAATSTVAALSLWSASTGGTLLGYTPYTSGVAGQHVVKFIATASNAS